MFILIFRYLLCIYINQRFCFSGAVGGGLDPLDNSRFEEDFPKDGTIRSTHRSERMANTLNPAPRIKPVKEMREKKVDKLSNASTEDDNRSRTAVKSQETYSANMQTLGKVSLNLRNKSLSEEDTMAYITPYLEMNSNDPPGSTDHLSHRQSISKLLTIDFAKNSESSIPSSNANSLIDFEKEIAAVDGNATGSEQRSKTSNLDLLTNDSSPVTNGPSLGSTPAGGDFRFSFTSVSSNSATDYDTTVEGRSGEENGSRSDLSALNTPNQSPKVDRQAMAYSTGAIPKNASALNKLKPSNNGRSSSRKHSNDDGSSPRNRKSFFKMPNIVKNKITDRIQKSFNKKPSTSTDVPESTIIPALLDFDAQTIETTDDILDKYRAKSSNYNGETASLNVTAETLAEIRNDLATALTVPDKVAVFNNTKRKLRRVLSLVDIQALPFLNHPQNVLQVNVNGIEPRQKIELIKFLKVSRKLFNC